MLTKLKQFLKENKLFCICIGLLFLLPVAFGVIMFFAPDMVFEFSANTIFTAPLIFCFFVLYGIISGSPLLLLLLHILLPLVLAGLISLAVFKHRHWRFSVYTLLISDILFNAIIWNIVGVLLDAALLLAVVVMMRKWQTVQICRLQDMPNLSK